MLTAYAIGLTATVLVVVAWLLVQLSWRRLFAAGRPDVDALAGRMGCHGCSGEPADCSRHGGCPDKEIR